MDAMPLTLDTPAEDEIAVSALTGAQGPAAARLHLHMGPLPGP